MVKQKLTQIHNDIIKPLAFAFFLALTCIVCWWTFTEVAGSVWGILGVGFWWVSLVWVIGREKKGENL